MKKIITKSLIASLSLITIGCQPNSQKPDEATLNGSLTYLARIALTPGASAHVRLIDSQNKLLAEQTINPAGQIPIPFSLHYLPSSQAPYQLEAEIQEHGQRRFHTTQTIAVEPTQTKPLQIRLQPTQ